MATAQMSQRRGMPEATIKLVMEIYRADDRWFEDTQLWIDRYLPEEALKDKFERLRTLYVTQSDLMLRLRNEDLVKYSAAIDQAGRHTGRHLQSRLEDDMETYAEQLWGANWYDAFQNRPDVEECDTSLEEGYLLWIEMRAELLVVFSYLVNEIVRRIEVAYGERAPLLLGGFVAGRAALYEAGVLKTDTDKWIEERTALMYVAAYSLLPPSDDDAEVKKELEKIIRAGVRVCGIRFARSYQPDLGRLEEAAFHDWSVLHVPENVIKRYNWIEEASKGGGIRKEPVFEIVPLYAQELKEGELFKGKFPTPFFEVPDRFWKQSIMKDEMFPPNILSGKVTLKSVNSDSLFLTSRNKQTPSDLIIADRGSGKTTLSNATGCWRIDRGYVVFRPTMPRDQDLLDCIPLTPWVVPQSEKGQSPRSQALLRELSVTPNMRQDWKHFQALRLEPRGMPCRFVTVYETAEDVRYDEPYTIHDVKVHVNNLEEFRLDWVKLLKAFPSGYLMFRDLASDPRTQKMRSRLINDFFNYRRLDRSRKVSLQIDEVQDVYGAVFGSSEEAGLVRTMQHQMNDIRGLGVPSEFATRSPAMLQPDILESVNTFIFSEVRESGADESRSSRQRLLKALRSRMPDSEKRFLILVERIMENIKLRDMHLFFMHDHNRVLRLIQATLPPHMIEDPNTDTKTQLRNYEKIAHTEVLVDSWEQVPELEAMIIPKETGTGVKPFGLDDEEQL